MELLDLGSGSFDTGDQKLTIGGILGETGGSQSLTKTGSGELVLKANNTYTGATNVNQGTLTIDGGDLADASTVNVDRRRTLQVISGARLGDIAGLGVDHRQRRRHGAHCNEHRHKTRSPSAAARR